jgi:hypothetical protein
MVPMKKIILTVLILGVIAVGSAGAGTWQVTFANWTESPGPNLVNEKVIYNGVELCTVAAGAPKTCSWVLPQAGPFAIPVIIRSYDAAANFAEYTGPVLNPTIAPASGGTVIIQWLP